MKDLRPVSVILILSLLNLCVGLIYSMMRNVNAHMELMVTTAILFPHAVALAYVSSLNRRDFVLREVTFFTSLPLVLMPLNFTLIKSYSVIPFTLMIVYSALSTRLWKGSVKYSLLIVAISYVYLTYALLHSNDVLALALDLSAYLITLIVAVTSHSLPSTFRDEALWYVSMASAISTSLVFINYKYVIIPLLLYFVGAKLWKLPRYLEIVKRYDRRSFAYRGNMYFLVGHAFVIASIVLTSIAALADPLTFLHAFLLSFVTEHIYIHAPMMLPVILRIRHKRNYMNWIYVFPLISAILWPFLKDLAWLVYVIGLYFLARVMV